MWTTASWETGAEAWHVAPVDFSRSILPPTLPSCFIQFRELDFFNVNVRLFLGTSINLALFHHLKLLCLFTYLNFLSPLGAFESSGMLLY